MINTHADRLHNLVEDILDLSRIESGALPLELGVYPVHEMVNAVVGQIRPLAKEKALTIEINIKRKCAMRSQAHRTGIAQLARQRRKIHARRG